MSHLQTFCASLTCKKHPTQHVPSTWGLEIKLGGVLGSSSLAKCQHRYAKQNRSIANSHIATLPNINMNTGEPNSCFHEELPNGVYRTHM